MRVQPSAERWTGSEGLTCRHLQQPDREFPAQPGDLSSWAPVDQDLDTSGNFTCKPLPPRGRPCKTMDTVRCRCGTRVNEHFGSTDAQANCVLGSDHWMCRRKHVEGLLVGTQNKHTSSNACSGPEEPTCRFHHGTTTNPRLIDFQQYNGCLVVRSNRLHSVRPVGWVRD